MSAPFTEGTPIKLEENGENVTEIQSYLAGFQKEIGGDASITQASGMIIFVIFPMHNKSLGTVCYHSVEVVDC